MATGSGEPEDCLLLYDIAKDEWEIIEKDIGVGGGGQGVTGPDDCIHLMGGYKDQNKNRKYNVKKREWSEGTRMTKKRWHGRAAIDSTGKIYLYGGYVDRCISSSDMSIYDPKKKEWSSGTPMPSTNAFFAGELNEYLIYLITI